MEIIDVKDSKVKLCPVCKVLPLLMSEGEATSTSGGKPQRLKDHQLFNKTGAAPSLCIRQPFDDANTMSTLLDDFEIVKLIGRGACGRVKLVRKVSKKREQTDQNLPLNSLHLLFILALHPLSLSMAHIWCISISSLLSRRAARMKGLCMP